MRLSRALLTVAAAPMVAVLVAGCGSSGDTHVHEDGTVVTARPTPASAKPGGTVVRITITADDVHPSGSRVQVPLGKPVTLLINAAHAGELHVHSTPEQHVDYPQGTSAARLVIQQPGVVDVESHTLDKLIVQLEVK
ncbi:hypothetical protein [Nocardioides terrisoli]|uniref:hypothetical protein n=1 Tax=Nocardioides terrisoli TaxID=3388267 RepID=UPI00287BBD83|nr:hypothetical protein [Nocardioides marmorisolisilvae]